jgi:hypothetical protein
MTGEPQAECLVRALSEIPDAKRSSIVMLQR